MSDYYCDFANGDDGAGAGTAGDPWKTVTKCLTVADGGDTVWIGDGGAQVLAAEIAWDAAKTTSNDAIILFRGWEYLAGAQAPSIGDIDGNDAVARLFALVDQPDHVTFLDLKLHRTTGFVLEPENYWNWINCEIYDGSGAYLIKSSTYQLFVGCEVYDGAVGLGSGTAGVFIGNYIHDMTSYGIYGLGSGSVAILNVIADCDDALLSLTGGDRTVLMNNTLDRTGQATASREALYIDANTERLAILNNLMVRHDADTTGAGIDWRAGCSATLYGHNHFFGNTAHDTGTPVKTVDLGNDKDGDPGFTDRANGNYEISAGPAEMGWPRLWPGLSTQTYIDVGAVQRREDWIQRRTLIDEDMYVDGVLQTDTLQPPDGSFSNSHVALNAGLATSKMRHKYVESYGQTGAAADETKLIHLVSGATATTLRFSAGAISAPTAGSVTVDLLKGGVSILAAAITIGAVDRVLTAATIDTPASVVGDWLEIVINDTASDATGVYAQLEIDEDPPA